MGAKKLSDREERFAQEYIKNPNMAQASIRAGYSKSSAKQLGSRIYNRPHVKARIDELLKPLVEKAGIDAEYITEELKKVVEEETGSPRVQALKLLGMRVGYFEKHNSQKNPFKPEAPSIKKELPNEWK